MLKKLLLAGLAVTLMIFAAGCHHTAGPARIHYLRPVVVSGGHLAPTPAHRPTPPLKGDRGLGRGFQGRPSGR